MQGYILTTLSLPTSRNASLTCLSQLLQNTDFVECMPYVSTHVEVFPPLSPLPPLLCVERGGRMKGGSTATLHYFY